MVSPLAKQDVRRMMKERERDFIEGAGVAVESDAIWQTVESSPEFFSARKVLIYMDIPGEVPTGDFISKWSSCKDFVLPLVVGDSLELRRYDPAHLVVGYRGIMEPSADSEPVRPEEVDLALVPGVAFSSTVPDAEFPLCVTLPCHRMGRGKGFYDRLLPGLKCRCFGIGFSFRWMSRIPLDPWDAPLK